MRFSSCGTAYSHQYRLCTRIQPLLGLLSLQRFSLRYRYILRFVGVQLAVCVEEWCLGFCDRGVFGREECSWFLRILWLLSSGG